MQPVSAGFSGYSDAAVSSPTCFDMKQELGQNSYVRIFRRKERFMACRAADEIFDCKKNRQLFINLIAVL